MKATYGTILVLAVAMVILLSRPLPCGAVEDRGQRTEDRGQKTEDRGQKTEGEAREGYRRFELTDERVERIMARLAESDPEKAEELAQLREKNPEKFKAELRKTMRERFRERVKRERGEIPWRKSLEGPDVPVMRPGGRRERQRSEMREARREKPAKGMRMREKHAAYLEWLEKNYPEEAKKLAKLREKRPKLHMRQLGLGHKKYRRIIEAEKENPELAKALKEDLELKKKRDELLRKIRAASDDEEKKKLVAQLEEVISSRFELIVKRKHIKYELLSKRLEKLKERVKKSEAEIEKWKDVKFKNENVKARLEELVSETEKFKWD